MTPEHQIEHIMLSCHEILLAKGSQTKNTWEKYLWKIETIARDLRLCIESGDLDVDNLK